MIVVTGGAGFIGMNLVLKLIEPGYDEIVVIDNNHPRYMRRGQNKAWNNKWTVTYVSTDDSYLWLPFNKYHIDAVFHLGARTDTMEKDEEIFKRLNLYYSIFIELLCTEVDIPMIYASSAATYGDGEDGFDDDEAPCNLKPLNPYGDYKNRFDWRMLARNSLNPRLTPTHWYGFKFFNVYGNHESHKGKMASVIWHLYNQIKETGEVKLFRSHVDWCGDGEQKRDFVYIDDVVNTLIWAYNFRKSMPSGIYNLGTGQARTYNDLAKAIFKSLGKQENISYIDTPLEIRDSYQYYTCAKMDKLKEQTLWGGFKTLEEGIDLYIKQLENENC